MFRNNPDRYSVILTDVRMPELSGITLAMPMQKVRPGVKIVIITGFEVEPQDLAMIYQPLPVTIF